MIYPGFVDSIFVWLGSIGVLMGLGLGTLLAVGALMRYVTDEKADEFLFGKSDKE